MGLAGDVLFPLPRTWKPALGIWALLWATALVRPALTPLSQTVVLVEQGLLISALAPSVRTWLTRLESAFPTRRGRVRLLAIVASLLLALPAFPIWIELGVDRTAFFVGGIQFTAAATSLFCVAAFRSIAETLLFLTRGARSLRTRLTVLGMASGALGALLAEVAFLPVQGPKTPWFAAAVALATVVLGAMIIYGFAGSLAQTFSRQLEQSAGALREVGRGNLEVRMAEEGRDELAQLARTFNEMVGELKEKSFLERAFGRYVATPVLDALRKSADLQIASARREATVLYADVRGFTAFSEHETPEEVMRVLNVYFQRIVEVVTRHEGYVNKFIGDAIMVVFGAPVAQPDHARRALACAAAMQAELARMNLEGAFGAGHSLAIGIGVNTGPLVAGSLGSAERAEYTVIGDSVNVAARLTSAAKPGEILAGEVTASEAGGALEELPPMMVKGKAAPLKVFRVRAT